MYHISNECKESLNKPLRDLRFKMKLDNLTIEDDIKSFDVSEGIISDEDFELGGAVASSLNIEINNVHGLYNSINFLTKEISLEIGILLPSGTIEYVPTGKYIVENSPKKGRAINIEAVDKMVNFEKDYETKLTFPTTAFTMLEEICNIAKVQLETLSSTIISKLKDYKIEKKLDYSTCREVLHDIAIIAGGWAKINRNGKLTIVTPTETDIEINQDNYINLEVKEGFFVDNLIIIETYFPVEAVQLNLNVVPFNCKWRGNIGADCGDVITISDGKNTHKTLVTSNKITFNGGLTYESSCSGLNEQQKETQHIGNQKKLGGRFASEIKQMADSITMKVSKDDVYAMVVLNEEGWNVSVNGKLSGKTYNFDGEGFRLGGTDSNNYALHTNEGSTYKFEDGSLVKIGKDGFYNMIGGTKREYHHLNTSDRICLTGIYNKQTTTTTYQLPDEYKNKKLSIQATIEEIRASNGEFLPTRQRLSYSYDRKTGVITFNVYVMGYFIIRRYNDEVFGENNSAIVVPLDKQESETIDLDISFSVIA